MTKDIQNALATYLVKKGHEAVCENYGHLVFEMDVASLSKSGMLHEFEVKISRSDFICDKKKGRGESKFDQYANPIGREGRCPNYFFYVCPEGLIKANEIPFFAGLYYYENGEVRLIRNAKRLHPVPAHKTQVMAKMLRMIIQRKYLGCTMLTYKNNQIKERIRRLSPSTGEAIATKK